MGLAWVLLALGLTLQGCSRASQVAPERPFPERPRKELPRTRLLLRTVDVQGRPIEGVRVGVDAHYNRQPASRFLTTDAQGELHLEGDDAYGRLLTFEAPGHCVEERGGLWSHRGERYLRQVRIRPAVTVSGRVVDAKGQPIPNARVEAGMRYHRVLRLSGTSDAQGHFSLTGLCAGPVWLRASAPGFSDLDQQATVPTGPLVFTLPLMTLPSPARLTVRVRGEHGQPLNRAPVNLAFKEVVLEDKFRRSDLQGEARFGPLAPGPYRVSAVFERGHEALVTASTQVELAAGQEHTVVLSFEGLRFRPPLKGKVVDSRGLPVFAASIRASVSPPVKPESAGMLWEVQDSHTTSSPQGTFLLPSLREGALTLEVHPTKCCPYQRFPVPPGESEPLLVLKPYQLAFEGRVLRTDGTPVTRFSVSGVPFENAEGRFSYTAPEGAGAPVLRIRAEGLEPEDVKTEKPRGPKPEVLPDIRLGHQTPPERRRTVRGRVVAEDGHTPVVFANVVRLDEDAVNIGQGHYTEGHTETDADGRFVMENVPRLPQRLRVESGSEGVALQSIAAEQNEVTIRLSRGAEVTGVVTDAHGRPVPEAQVAATCAFPWTGGVAHTDPQGRYVLRGLGPHACALKAWVEANAMAYDELTPPRLNFPPQELKVPASGTVRVDLAARSGPASLQLDLLAAGESVRFYVLEGDVPLPSSIRQLKDLGRRGLMADVSLEEDDRIPFPWMYARSYQYSHLPLGRYTVFAVELEGVDLGGGHVRRIPVDLTAPGTTRVEADISGQEPFLPP